MAYYVPLHHPSSAAIAVDEIPYSGESTSPLHQKESFLDRFSRIDPSSLPPPPKQNVSMAAISFVWRTLFLPATALAYVAFCYVCHYKLVRVGVISNPMEHLPIIKSGVTSLSILFVSLGLLPLYSLISDLKSEEFFRALTSKHSGAPLTTINGISTPSYGMCDTLKTMYRRHASGYFTSAFFAGLVALATSTLAPAALSVSTVLFDGDLVALSVGAVYRNSVMNASDFSQPQQLGTSDAALVRSPEAISVAWAEFSLGVNYSFQSPTVDQTAYIVPAPLKLTPDTRGRWISDVVAMQPTCEWIAPVFQTPDASLSDPTGNLSTSGGNSSDLGGGLSDFGTTLVMNMTSKNVQITIQLSDINGTNFGVSALPGNWFAGLGGFLPGSNAVLDLETMDDLTNGATVWRLHQCVTGCTPPLFEDTPINVTFGSDVKSSRFSVSNSKTVDVSLLYCAPNAQIRTHQISSDGQGFLTIGDKAQASQGNLHPIQTNLLMSFAFNNFATAGPQTAPNVSDLGNEAQFGFMFGKAPLTSTQFTPRPINDLSTSYSELLKSATKPFLDGSVATAYVPGRTTQEIVVFRASLPHIIVSTVLYIILIIFVLVCHFRRQVPQFTFFAVAASLARSDIPPLFAQFKEVDPSKRSEDHGVSALGSARVHLEGGQVLKLGG